MSLTSNVKRGAPFLLDFAHRAARTQHLNTIARLGLSQSRISLIKKPLVFLLNLLLPYDPLSG